MKVVVLLCLIAGVAQASPQADYVRGMQTLRLLQKQAQEMQTGQLLKQETPQAEFGKFVSNERRLMGLASPTVMQRLQRTDGRPVYYGSAGYGTQSNPWYFFLTGSAESAQRLLRPPLMHK